MCGYYRVDIKIRQSISVHLREQEIRNMAPQRRNLATFTLIIGVLTLILAVSALAEKSHEGHLPERNDRGTAEAIVSSGIPGGILLLCSIVSGTNRHRHSITGTFASFGHSCCPAMASRSMTM
jgi:hypothetical protein